MSCDVGEVTESLENEQSSFSNLSVTYVTTHSPTLPSLYLHHGSFANLSIVSPTSQFILQTFFRFSYVTELILQPFRHFTYVTAHSPNLPSLYLRRSSFFNPSVASPTSQFILQSFFRFSYVMSSFSNLSVTLPTSQLILQTFRRFTYVTAHPPTLPLLHLRHSSFSNPSFVSPTS